MPPDPPREVHGAQTITYPQLKVTGLLFEFLEGIIDSHFSNHVVVFLSNGVKAN